MSSIERILNMLMGRHYPISHRSVRVSIRQKLGSGWDALLEYGIIKESAHGEFYYPAEPKSETFKSLQDGST